MITLVIEALHLSSSFAVPPDALRTLNTRSGRPCQVILRPWTRSSASLAACTQVGPMSPR